MRLTIAYALFCLAFFLALVAIFAVCYDIIVPPQSGGSSPAQMGAYAGAVIRIIFRTVILIVLSLILFCLGLQLRYPEKYSENAIKSRQLVEIASQHGTHTLGEQPSGVNEFSVRTDAELVDIYHSIDRNKHSERFNALVWAICDRCDQNYSS